MFSKALLKQSCKANGLMWAIVTIASCFMLACVMLISGKGEIASMKTGISNTIIIDAIDSSVKDTSINYYEISNGALAYFDAGYLQELGTGGNNADCLLAGLTSADNFLDTSAPEQSPQLKTMTRIILNIGQVSGNPVVIENMYNDFYTEESKAESERFGAETAPNISNYLANISTMSSVERSAFRGEWAKSYSTIYLSKSFVSPIYIDTIISNLSDYGVNREEYEMYTYEKINGEAVENVSRYTGATGYQFLKQLSTETVIEYRAKIEYQMSLPGATLELVKQKVHKDITDSFLSTLPTKVSDALTEMGKIDMYSMIVGSIFFKMSGLLLPIIYMIMCANNLIAGQVDSGSMAYILSTSTKRKQVVFTQAFFLITSLFLMFCCTYVTSIICFRMVEVPNISLTYSKLLFLNIGAFLSMFAMSGIAFLASCYFNRSKHSMSIGGGLNMFFLVATMLGLFGSKILPSVTRMDALNYFNYFSIITLFDSVSIINSTYSFIWKFAVLIGIGLACYIIGGRKFKKKDLPL